jgi:hypothetical protein
VGALQFDEDRDRLIDVFNKHPAKGKAVLDRAVAHGEKWSGFVDYCFDVRVAADSLEKLLSESMDDCELIASVQVKFDVWLKDADSRALVKTSEVDLNGHIETIAGKAIATIERRIVVKFSSSFCQRFGIQHPIGCMRKVDGQLRDLLFGVNQAHA